LIDFGHELKHKLRKAKFILEKQKKSFVKKKKKTKKREKEKNVNQAKIIHY
jgi:hypothetical protein